MDCTSKVTSFFPKSEACCVSIWLASFASRDSSGNSPMIAIVFFCMWGFVSPCSRHSGRSSLRLHGSMITCLHCWSLLRFNILNESLYSFCERWQTRSAMGKQVDDKLWHIWLTRLDGVRDTLLSRFDASFYLRCIFDGFGFRSPSSQVKNSQGDEALLEVWQLRCSMFESKGEQKKQKWRKTKKTCKATTEWKDIES